MNIIIGDQWINLDNVQLIGVFDNRIHFTFGRDEVITIPMTGPGAKSAWTWLQKSAVVFDESTDAELESAEYQRGDKVEIRSKVHGGIFVGTITHVIPSRHHVDPKYHEYRIHDGLLEVNVTADQIIGLAPETESTS